MRIPFSPPDITQAEVQEVAQALMSGWITTGPKTKELERQVAQRCGTNYAVCLNSQTACSQMTLRLLGVGPAMRSSPPPIPTPPPPPWSATSVQC